MKRLQGWTETSILDFNYLAADGERLLLSVRYTGWTADQRCPACRHLGAHVPR